MPIIVWEVLYETKKYIVELGCGSRFHHAYWCGAVHCSWRQPPVPGADASIPDTAYQNYRYDKTRNITTADHIKKMEEYNKRIDGEVLEKKGTAEQAEQLKKSLCEVFGFNYAWIHRNFIAWRWL